MKVLRTLRGQFSLILIVSILIPVSVIGYYAVIYTLAEKNSTAETSRQLMAAAEELQPLFQGPGREIKDDRLTALAPTFNGILRGYLPIRLSYYNGDTFYTLAPSRGKGNVDALLVNAVSGQQLDVYKTAIAQKTQLVTRETEGDFPETKGVETYLTVGSDKQGLLVLDARLTPFFLENRTARGAVGASLLLGLLLGVCGVLVVSHRLQSRINNIQTGLERAANNLELPLEPQSGELGTVVNSINQMREELVSKRKLEQQLQATERLAGLGKLTAGVAHEIRNPLGIMKGTVQLMERDIHSEPALAKYREYMHVLHEQIDRQNHVVEELLSYAKPVKPRFGPVSIPGVIDSVLSFLSPSLQQQGIVLTTDIAGDLPNVFGDREKLKQVLVNLLINSKEALHQHGEIKIAAFSRGRHVVVQVTDNGPGIPAENLPHIFEPFFSTKEAGTGLGLSIAKQLIELHKGEILLTSEPGSGTCFTVKIPAGGGADADDISN